jgi:hypothetical protein
MNSSDPLVASAALFLVVGCTGQDSVPPTAETSLGKSQAETRSAQTELEPSVATPDQQDESLGLPIGAMAPAFELKDQNGQSRSLADILESRLTALVFYRSADW